MRIMRALCLVIFVVAVSYDLSAALPTPAPLQHLVPIGLNAGDSFQLLFVTREGRDALSDDILQYNTFVNLVADSAGIGPSAAGVDWFAIGSTSTVDARDNALVQSPVYNLQGDLVVTGYTDMWDGELVHAIEYDEYGVPIISYHHAWTGSELDGTKHPGHELGASTTEMGDLKLGNSLWIEGTNGSGGIARHFYALSEPLLVKGISEPSCLALMTFGTFDIHNFVRRQI